MENRDWGIARETDNLEAAGAMKSDKHDLGLPTEVYAHADLPVRVTARAYGRFSGWIDCELKALVVRWAHVAPPAASRPPRFRFRAARPE